MKIYKNCINGKEYFYARDSIYISKGNTIQKTRSLGPVDDIGNIKLRQQDFYNYIVQEEARQRIQYWSKKQNSKEFQKYTSIEKIENARARLYRAKQRMGDLGTIAMETAFLVDFIYNSNKIEGSRIPRERVEKIVRNNGKGDKNHEVVNTMKALKYLDRTTFRFNVKQIEKLHAIMLAHEPTKHKLRKESIIVGNARTLPWEEVRAHLKTLCDESVRKEKYHYPVEHAFNFYYQFERIHPFVDGNGRVGRLLMNVILKNHRYHPIIIWDKRRQAHMNAFNKYISGKGEYYYKFMEEQFIKTHDVYTEKIERVFNLEKQMEYFLTPSQYSTSK